MTLPGLYLPNDENVMVAWVKRYVGSELGGAGVATVLPDSLPSDGFVTCTSVRAGIAPVDLPTHHSLVTIDAWAPTGDGKAGGRPQWNRALQLLMRIIAATDSDSQAFGQELDLGAAYLPARVLSVWRDNEPRRVPGDPSGYARYTLDVNADWCLT